MSMKVRSSRLTTCAVADDGSAITLGLIDKEEGGVSVDLPLDQAEAMVMTLPRLLTRALQVRSGNANARYVFPLGRWSIEQTQDTGLMIFTLETEDGFQVSFALPCGACGRLGLALLRERMPAAPPEAVDDAGDIAPAKRLN